MGQSMLHVNGEQKLSLRNAQCAGMFPSGDSSQLKFNFSSRASFPQIACGQSIDLVNYHGYRRHLNSRTEIGNRSPRQLQECKREDRQGYQGVAKQLVSELAGTR